MNIKSRLTFQFGALSTLFLGAAFFVIYLLSEDYRKDEFYDRLTSHAVNIAKILIEVDEIDDLLLYKIEKDNPVRLSSQAIKIYNFKNELLFAIDYDYIIAFDSAQLNRIRLDSVIADRIEDRESIGFLFTSRYDRFVIQASAVDVYGHRKIKNLRNILLIVFGVGVLITFLTARFFANQAIKPVEQLNLDIGGIMPTDLSKRLSQSSGNDEIAELANSFNFMMARVESAFKTRKNFIANASHEMRTPLTAITGQLEVLQIKDRTTEDYKVAIASVIDDMHSLNRLANRLLLLAQTENDEVVKSFEPTRVDEVIWNCAKDVRKLNKAYCVSIDFDPNIEDDSLTIFGSSVLLKSVIINLMENGCKYSKNKSSNVLLKADNSALLIEFKDSGIGIPKEELSQIFNPFFRGSNVSGISGHGIGLSLVKRIIDLHQSSISFDSTIGVGTKVLVSLPILKK